MGCGTPTWDLEGAVMSRSHDPQGGSREPPLDQAHERKPHLG